MFCVEAMWLLLARGIRARGRLLGATGFGSTNPTTAYSRSIRKDAPPNVEFGEYRPASALAEEFLRRGYFLFAVGLGRALWLSEMWRRWRADFRWFSDTGWGRAGDFLRRVGQFWWERGSAPELASALEALIRNRAQRRELATQGYSSFQQNFTWKAAHRRYREVLGSLGETKSGGPVRLERMAHVASEGEAMVALYLFDYGKYGAALRNCLGSSHPLRRPRGGGELECIVV